jgi:hypothetical protein
LILTEWDQFRYPSQKPSLLKKNPISMKGIGYYLEQSMCHISVLDMHMGVHGVSHLENSHVRYDPQSDIHKCFRPEPECPDYCRDCARDNLEASQADENLRWEIIVHNMQQPKWVFDGRGVVDEKSMESLGFRVEAIGRASVRSRLRGRLKMPIPFH